MKERWANMKTWAAEKPLTGLDDVPLNGESGAIDFSTFRKKPPSGSSSKANTHSATPSGTPSAQAAGWQGKGD